MDGDHVVQFYDNDDSLVGVVGSYLAASVRDGESAIVVAAPEHRMTFLEALDSSGIDVGEARRDGRLVDLDAADTIARFTRDGRIDPEAFDEVVGGAIRQAAAGRPVRAYGEMVALLWNDGDVAGAITLEDLWNELGATVPFSLFCAYPTNLFADSSPEAFGDLLHLHTAVIDETWVTQEADVIRWFEGTPRAPGLARRFVAETLHCWHLDALANEATIIVSELASNAVLHAHSNFTIALSRVGDGIRISVTDRSLFPPYLRPSDPEEPHGTGLHMVGSIAREWGHDVVRGGKRVWAEVGPTSVVPEQPRSEA
jgi:anti-sigma regulatory factor (Ser/Thr protein kinase)